MSITSHLNTVEYANSVVNNDVDRTIDLFSRRNGRDSYFFQYVLWVLMIDSHDSHDSPSFLFDCFEKFGQITRIFRQMVHRLLRPKITCTLMAMSSNLLITLVVNLLIT